jgi:hypothetical protein
MQDFEKALLSRLDRLEEKLDKVRTEDLPAVKVDVAVLINENKTQSKLHSFIGAVSAIIVSALIPHR